MTPESAETLVRVRFVLEGLAHDAEERDAQHDYERFSQLVTDLDETPEMREAERIIRGHTSQVSYPVECAWCRRAIPGSDHTLCPECQRALAAEDAYARSLA